MITANATSGAAVGVARGRVDIAAPDECELVARACGGSHAAFGELVRRHQGKLRAQLLRLCGDAALADDLAQDTFVRAYRALGGFECRAGFSTWLHRIGCNVFLTHAARSARALQHPAVDDDATAAPDDATSPRRVDLRRDLTAVIARLPATYRGVVTLHYVDGASYVTIAERLALPLGTVKTHLFRAKRMLREALDEDGDGGSSHGRGEGILS